MPLGIYPTVDYVFKRLFGSTENADLLIHLLNAVLQPQAPIVEVEIQNPFLEKEFEDDKLAVLDIRACDVDRCWFNIEMQTTVPAGLRERLAYYTSCLYVEQMADGMQYRELLPTISICFLSKLIFPEVRAAHLRFAMADLEHRVSLTDRLQIHTIELAKYNETAESLLSADSLEKWTYFLNHAAELEAVDLQSLLPDPPYRKATGVLEMISQSPEQRRLHDARVRAERDYINNIEGAKADAWEEGRKEGRAEGWEIGREEGWHEAWEKAQKEAFQGQIRLLKKFLGETQIDAGELAALDLPSLQSMAAALEAKLDQAKGQ